MLYDIKPVAKPRMTQRDKWLKPARPGVAKYRAFKEEVRLMVYPEHAALAHCTVVFRLPMPMSWSKKKKAEMEGTPHTSRPDLDNLFKALADALHAEDSHIHTIACHKEWGHTGGIVINTVEELTPC